MYTGSFYIAPALSIIVSASFSASLPNEWATDHFQLIISLFPLSESIHILNWLKAKHTPSFRHTFVQAALPDRAANLAVN